MTSYREILRNSLTARLTANPRYSLRAFARDLALSPSYLSQVLNGTRGLTLKKSAQVFQMIGLSIEEQAYYSLEIRKEHLRKDIHRAAIEKQMASSRQKMQARTLDADQFERISQWYPVVLLQLFFLKEAPLHSRPEFETWARKKLGIPKSAVVETLKEFLSLRLIAETGKGYTPLHETIWTTSGVPSAAIRRFHRQMIERALLAIETQAITERILHSVQITVRSEDLPRMSQDLLKFRDMILRKYGRASDRSGDEVYGLNLQLFRLSEA